MTDRKQTREAEDSIKCIAIFRKRLNEILKTSARTPILKEIAEKASDRDIKILIDLGMAVGGMKLTSVKAPLIVSTCSLDDKQKATARMIRSNLIVQVCIAKIPNAYKKVFLEFLEEGYDKQKHHSYVLNLVLFYMQTDRKNSDIQWVNHYDIDRYLNEDTLSSKDKEYFNSLYAHGSRVVKKLKNISDAVSSGAKTHGFVLTLMKEDQFLPALEYYENGRVAGDALLIQHSMEILGISDKFTLEKREQTLVSVSSNNGKRYSIRALLTQLFK